MSGEKSGEPKHDSQGSQATQLYERYFPGRNEDHHPLELPVREVTLLEDRAQICRRGTVTLEVGRNQLRIDGVAPVLQDVSLRGELVGDCRGAIVSDLRVRRAIRVRRDDEPEQIRELEAAIDEQLRQYAEASEDRERAEHRYGVVLEMLAKGAAEIPEDAAWGLVNRQVWADTFETLTKRAQDLLDVIAGRYFKQLDAAEEVEGLAEKRRAFDRRDVSFCAFIELDVISERGGEVELSVEYVVPNALWRPFHSARLEGQTLRFCSRAAVWQNCGEDWRDVALSFSTARASLGTEAPLLDDDLLAAQRRSEKVVVERRQVAVQSTGLGREPQAAPLASSAVDLPGVDDGGEVQNLKALGQATVVSNGLLNVVPVFEFEVEAQRELLCMPELAQKTFDKSVQANTSPYPILAGPVELVRDSGVVGWTQVLYVAPGERFELSFGHDDGLRVYRTQKHESEVDAIDGWTHNDAWVTLYLSNLAGEEKALEVVERVPVSEIEHVQVKIDDQACKPRPPKVDERGFCRWQVTLPPHGRETLCLAFRLSTAPEVEGM